MSGFRFLRNALLFSLVGLIPPLALYIAATPGLSAALSQGGPALLRFLRQVVTNGLPVVFVINYVSFFLYALSNQAGQRRDPLAFVALDVFAKLSLFFSLHAIIYVLSSDWYGSFGGSRLTAVSVVAPTLSRSAFFENISGVYFYATLVGAIPLYVSVFKKSKATKMLIARIPFDVGAITLAVASFASTAVLLTFLARLIVRIQG